MANISILSRLVNGAQRNVDLSANTLVVGGLTIGSATLTPTITSRLISLQNGTDVDATYHTHNTIYYTQAQLAAHATPGASGAKLIGDGNTYSHISPAGTTVEDALLALDAATGSAATAVDSTFRIVNFTDNTKKIAFSAAGITTGTVRTITMPDADVNLGLVNTAIQANGSVAFTADQSHGGFKITNLANGVSAQDAVTLNQLQSAQAGMDWKQHVRAMSDSNITLSGTQTVDSVALIAGDRILVQNQTTASQNGIYVVAAGAWSRSSDATTGTQLTAAATYIDEGTNYKGSAWVQTAPAPITVGTTAITFVKFATILPLVFRNGLAQTGQNIDVVAGDTSLLSTTGSLIVNLATGSALVTSSGLKINLESTNPTLQIAANQLGIKLDPARAITTGAAGVGVNVDGTTIAITANAVGVKNAGISATQLATGAFDQVTITGGAGAAAAVASAPAVIKTFVAGQAFSANTTYALRFGIPALGETAGRVYAADYDSTTNDKFWCVGVFNSASAVSIAGNVSAVVDGALTIASGDAVFASGDQGYPVWLGSAGAYLANSAVPTGSKQADFKLGLSMGASQIWVDRALMGVNA